MSQMKKRSEEAAQADSFPRNGSTAKKTALVTALFVYTVLCGILIADLGTSAVAGSTRMTLIGSVTAWWQTFAEAWLSSVR